MKSYVNLHSHGRYSILDGAATYEGYAKRAVELGLPAICTTEHGNISGWLEFIRACEGLEAPLKPILGIEAYQARKTRFDRDDEERASGKAVDALEQRGPLHLIILARNNVGYKNLIKISSEAFLTGFYTKPRVDHDLISQYSDGLIVLSGCLNGELQQHLLRDDYDGALKAAKTMQDIVGKDNYYVEVQNHDIAEQKYVYKHTVEIANHIGAKIVATQDSHYVHKEDADSHDLLLCINTASNKDDENRFRFNGSDFYLKSYDEMAKLFPEEWLENTLEVTEKIETNIVHDTLYFPEFHIPTDEDVDTYLQRLVWEGADKVYGNITDSIRDRLNLEIGVITRMGFQHYFLVVQDIINTAKSKGIRIGVGRGSAAGCCVSYCLGITGLDPIKWNLSFERFLVEGRATMPDIDIDICERRRDELIEYVKNTYGSDHIANIATFSRIKAKAAVRDAARVLGYEYQVGDKLSKSMPPAILGVTKTIDESLETSELAQLYLEPENRRIVDAARGIEGAIRQTGIHAAGIVIAPENVTDYIPVMQKGEGEPIITQWGMHDVELAGLLKVDFLGLRNLTVIDLAIINEAKFQMVQDCPRDENGFIDFYNIPLDDTEVYSELSRGNNVGVFQVECLSGDTIISNTTIAKLYKSQDKKTLRSVYLDEGKTHINDILGIFQSGTKKVYALITEDGRYIKASAEHLFMTDKGWQKLGDLSVGHKILIDDKAKYKVWRTCIGCGLQINGDIKKISERCYRCSAKFNKNPSKEGVGMRISKTIQDGYASGRKPWNYGLSKETNLILNETGHKISESLYGRTWEDIHGTENAATYRKNASERMSGRNNHMFGKPPPMTKRGYRKDLGHYVRSSWEADFARVLIHFGIEYEYEPQTFLLKRSDGSELNYTPDFYVPSQDTYYEIKGFMRRLCQEKLDLFSKQYPDKKLILIDQTLFAEFELKYRDLVEWECPIYPKDFSFHTVKDIIFVGEEMTYDISMKSPANNFIASSFMVHNSSGLQSMAVSMKPDRYEDIMALISLYRPGPLGSNMDKMYINRKHGREKVRSYHPKLDMLLKNNYGVMLYQEDVTSVTKTLAGFTVSEADLLRKAIGKKELDKIGLYRKKFVDGCKKESDIQPLLAEKIYDDIEYFGGYGFNRPHSAGYSFLCYATMYLKLKAPAPYMAALLSTVVSSEDRAGTYINECRRLGIKVRTPSINESEADFKVISENEILYGFSSVKGFGPVVVDNLTKGAKKEPFKSIYDFFRRVDVDVLDKKNFDHLLDSGCLDELVNVENETISRSDKLEILDIERKELGIYITDHPLSDIWEDISDEVTDTIGDIYLVENEKKTVTLCGVLSNLEKKTTKRGDIMGSCKIEDLTGSLDVTLFNKTYLNYKDVMENGKICIITGIVMNDGDDVTPLYKMHLRSLKVLKDIELSAAPPIILKVDGKYPLNYDIIESIEALIDSQAGDSYVLLDYEIDKRTIRMQFKKPTGVEVKEKLEQLIGMVNYVESL